MSYCQNCADTETALRNMTALAGEAGEVMEGLRVSTITCSRVLGDKILPLGGLHPERVREQIEPILTKLRAAGILKGGV